MGILIRTVILYKIRVCKDSVTIESARFAGAAKGALHLRVSLALLSSIAIFTAVSLRRGYIN